MPQRSKVFALPEGIKRELDKRLVNGGFSNYEALSTWLAENGYGISKSSLHRYGTEFEQRLVALKIATEQARAVVEAAGDEEGNMNEALIRLIQQESFNVLVKLNEEDKNAILPKLGIMVAKLSKASVDQKKWAQELRQKARTAVENIEKKAGEMDKKELLKLVKKEVYGLV
jgi:hypothetical protein